MIPESRVRSLFLGSGNVVSFVWRACIGFASRMIICPPPGVSEVPQTVSAMSIASLKHISSGSNANK